MSFLSFCQWLSQTPLSIWLRDAPYPYPVLLIVHVISIALFGGTVVIGNLRVLGKTMRSVPVSQVIGQFRAWKWVAFAILPPQQPCQRPSSLRETQNSHSVSDVSSKTDISESVPFDGTAIAGIGTPRHCAAKCGSE